MALNVDGLPSDQEHFQVYLSELDSDQLHKLEPALVERFKALRNADDNGNIDSNDAANKLNTIATQIQMMRTEMKSREESAVKNAAEETAAAHKAAMAELDKFVLGQHSDDSGQNNNDGGNDSGMNEAVSSMANVFANAIEKAVEKTTAKTAVTASAPTSQLNGHLRGIQRHTPDPKVGQARKEAVLVASADIPGRAKNGFVDGVSDLVNLMGSRVRMMPVTRGNPNYVPVAYLQRDYRYRLNLDSTPEEINEVLTAATDVDALVASGGWCAPSEISYDFFNIVCEDGLIDLPSVGILNRGGFRFPQSPDISDVFGDADALWSWTEANDESAADGAAIEKTCARIPCPDFDEVRAQCDGLCITASNLTDFAYPELISNYLRLVMAARAHRTNQQIINQLVAASSAVDMSAAVESATASLLNATELQALDYRERYRMCEDAVVEAVYPRWVLGSIRADLANRNGLALFEVTNQMIASWFDIRNIRVQFVADWQSGFSGDVIGDPVTNATEWPATADFLLYAPGTFVRGNGLQLDLGVVRDSVLNATNDHTAAWMEECYAVAQVGHESRVVTAPTCTAGTSGAAELSCADVS